MSIFDYLFSSELKQHEDIERLKRRQRTQRSMAVRHIKRRQQDSVRMASLEDEVADLQAQVGEMALYIKALVRMLAKRDAVDTMELLELIEVIDAEDGTVDRRTRL